MTSIKNTFGWRLHWIDLRDHRIGLPRPDAERRDFDTREAAEAEKTRLQALGIPATIKPIPVSMRKQERVFGLAQADMGFPTHGKDQGRLTR